jgi:hypothetical protein
MSLTYLLDCRLAEVARQIDMALDEVGFVGFLHDEGIRSDLNAVGVQVADVRAKIRLAATKTAVVQPGGQPAAQEEGT